MRKPDELNCLNLALNLDTSYCVQTHINFIRWLPTHSISLLSIHTICVLILREAFRSLTLTPHTYGFACIHFPLATDDFIYFVIRFVEMWFVYQKLFFFLSLSKGGYLFVIELIAPLKIHLSSFFCCCCCFVEIFHSKLQLP